MDSKNEIIEANQSLNMLIADSIELIQYARQITAKQVNLVQLMTFHWGNGLLRNSKKGKNGQNLESRF